MSSGMWGGGGSAGVRMSRRLGGVDDAALSIPLCGVLFFSARATWGVTTPPPQLTERSERCLGGLYVFMSGYVGLVVQLLPVHTQDVANFCLYTALSFTLLRNWEDHALSCEGIGRLSVCVFCVSISFPTLSQDTR